MVLITSILTGPYPGEKICVYKRPEELCGCSLATGRATQGKK